jgi:hypothetical protein
VLLLAPLPNPVHQGDEGEGDEGGEADENVNDPRWFQHF